VSNSNVIHARLEVMGGGVVSIRVSLHNGTFEQLIQTNNVRTVLSELTTQDVTAVRLALVSALADLLL
jgi:hypothetical protein